MVAIMGSCSGFELWENTYAIGNGAVLNLSDGMVENAARPYTFEIDSTQEFTGCCR